VTLLQRLAWRLLGARCCGNCRYWAEGDGDEENAWAQGTCRSELPRVVTYSAAAPVVVHGKPGPAQLNVQSYWPPVTPSEWCGRHRRRWGAR
jgi:hypothetical protein